MRTDAREKREKQRPRRKRRAGRGRLAALLLCLLLALALPLYMYVRANTIHIRRTTAYLQDLPDAFDGTTILYMSDFDLHGTNTPAKALALMRELQALGPDLLLLGGVYASYSLTEALRAKNGEAEAARDALNERRARFLTGLDGFAAPLGKYAVAGAADADMEALEAALRQGGVTPLADAGVVLTRGDSRLALIGLAPGAGRTRSLDSLAAQTRQADCVIVLAHDPGSMAGIQTSEAADGGVWADLVLSGGTHGGQVRLGKWTALRLGEFQRRYLSGWFRLGGTVLLTSCGVGCEGINLRLGTVGEAHLITLKRGVPMDEDFHPLNTDAPWRR